MFNIRYFLLPAEVRCLHDLQLSGSAVRAFVICFSIVGILIMVLIGHLSEVEEVELTDLKNHIGEVVQSRGVVLGTVHYGSGASKLLIFDCNDTAEVYIETSKKEFKPGSRIMVRGEVYPGDERPGITAANDRSIEVLGNGEISELDRWSEPWEVYDVRGTVVSSDRVGWDDHDLVILYFRGDVQERIGVLLLECEEGPGLGDLINVTGVLGTEGDLLCFGPGSLQILNRAVPRCISLRQLIQEMELGVASLEPRTLEGFLRYEPTGRSFYIGEEPSGSLISVKVKIPEPIEFIHKGDLVELVNCSITWDPQSLRYHLSPELVRLLEPYGTWVINLESLDYGVGEFEGCRVVVKGVLETINGTAVLLDGERSIIVVGIDNGEIGEEVELEGTIVFDAFDNRYRLIVEEGP